MTGKPPFDPMEAGDRTVIRPNPGGRRQAPAPQPAPSEPAPAPGPYPGAFPGASGEDAWLSDSGARQAVAAPPPPVPAAGVRSADLEAIRALDVADVNPVVRAARPLMMLLSNLRVSGSQQKVAPLMDAVAQSITEFERDLRAAGVSEDTVHTAKYVMCATADDIVQNIPGSDRHVWTQHSMLSRFFQMRTSGVGFFDELAKAKANPALHYDLLELMHACLSLGFEGQYRSSGGGDVALQQIRRDVYHTLRHIRPRVGDEISPHWRGQDIAAEAGSARIPTWAIASIAAAALLGIFVVLRLLLSQSSEVFAENMLNLHPDGEVVLARDAYEPFDAGSIEFTSTQLERIRAALADEIAAGARGGGPGGTEHFDPSRHRRAVPVGQRRPQGRRSPRPRKGCPDARQGAQGDHGDRALRQRAAALPGAVQVEPRPVGPARPVGRRCPGAATGRAGPPGGRRPRPRRSDRRQQVGRGPGPEPKGRYPPAAHRLTDWYST
jgi:type VI secretion system protein ImpK